MDQSTTRPVSVAPPREDGRYRGRSIGISVPAIYARLEAVLTVEVLIYFVFTAVAVGTRFWDLGSRPLHHDESLHAYFSWQYYVGRGYQHDPMMHGPLLFHLTRLSYHFFDLFMGVGQGDTNATARVMPAIFGTLLVPMPYLLRNQLGRAAMLAASFLLLISPGMWYYGRFARNEAWAVVFTLMSIIGIIRWMDSRNPRWLHFAWLGWVLLFCSKEISFIVIFIVVTFATLVFGVAHARRALAALAGWVVGVMMAMFVLPKQLGWADLPSIPFDKPSLEKSLNYAETMLTSAQVLSALGLTAVWLVVEAYLLWRADLPEQFRRIREGAPANALSTALAHLEHKGLHVLGMVLTFVVISVPLHTSFFTNIQGGLQSGYAGQLFYWLAQQEVERGGQPWYYYLVMEPVYEPIPVLLGTAGLIWGGIWAARRIRRGGQPLSMFQMSYALMVYWLVMSVLIYSWAGEKMPWLSVHITLPLVFLGTVFGARALWLERGWRMSTTVARSGTWAFAAVALVITGWIVFRMASWSLQTQPTEQSPLVWGLGALLLLAAAAGFWLGPARAVRTLGLTALGVFAVYTTQSAIQLSYANGAVPVEQMVYVQSSPRVENTIRAITGVSEKTVGGQKAPLIYDTVVAWPFVWYLRDFPNARFEGDGPRSVPTSDVQFVLIGADNEDDVQPFLKNYTAFRYPMRWWFPEEMYRNLIPKAEVEAAGPLRGLYLNGKYVLQGFASWRQPQQQAQLWRYVMYRRPDGILNSTDMVLYVRKDLVGVYNQERL